MFARILEIAFVVVVFGGALLTSLGLLALGAFYVWWGFFSDTIERYPSGAKKSRGTRHSGDMQGLWTFWYENGQKQCEGKFVAGWQDGLWSFWHENGQLRARGVIGDDGRKTGEWQYWDDEGQRITEAEYLSRDPLAEQEPKRD